MRSESKIAMAERMMKLLWALLIGAFLMGGWVTTIELRTQSTAKVVLTHQTRISEIDLWKERAEANRWTIQQQTEAMKVISDTQNLTERRLQRLEDTIGNINKTLDRIESKLQSK